MAGSLGSGARRVIVCDVGLVEADACAVDSLARLQLAARRAGCEIRVEGACPDLRALIALMGLWGVLGLEGRRKPEQREQAGGVQEEGDPPDPVA